jgi:hypothetical protein
MPKAYEAKTLTKFGTMNVSAYKNESTYSNAEREDAESPLIQNFNFNDNGGLIKRHGIHYLNSAIVPSITKPAGQALTAPTQAHLLGIQRIQAVYNDRLYFTDTTGTNLWYLELPIGANAQCHRIMTPTNQAITDAQWMIPAATPTSLFSMMVCRDSGPGCIINDQGYPQAFIAAMPAGTMMTTFKDRIFLINTLATNGDENKLYYSDESAYGTWGANSYNRIGTSNGDYLVSMIVFNDTLILFKSRSIWVLVADTASPAGWTYRNLHPTLGCVGRGTPTVISGMIYFLANDGCYRTDGTSFERISRPIETLFQLESAQPSLTLGREAIYYDDKYLINSYAGTTSMYLYDTKHEGWTSWTMSFAPAGFAVYTDIQTYRAMYIGNYTQPRIHQMYADEGMAGSVNNWTDAGSNYTCIWQSKRQTWDEPTKLKRNYYFMMDVSHTDGEPTTSITVTHKTDSNEVVYPWAQTALTPTAVNGDFNATSNVTRRELK